MNSIIKIQNIYGEDLFKWFYKHVMDSCGDGCGTIVCKNYKEAADWFIEWFMKKFKEDKFWHPKDEYGNIVNFHDDNENFVFTDTVPTDNFDGDYIFKVEVDCKFGCRWPKDRIIIGVGI